MSDNPLLQISDLPNKAPAFSKVTTDHYLPAIKEAIELARKNIEAVKTNDDDPDFENTIVALETASEILGQASAVFHNQLLVIGGDDMHALAEQIGPITAEFSNDVGLDPDLFARVKTVYDKKEGLNLNTEEMTLLTDCYKGFVRGGALLDDEKKKRYREISQELSVLGPAFMNNVVKSSEAFELVIEDKAELAGLPDGIIEAAAHAAEEKGHAGKYLFTLDVPSYMPFVQYAENRAHRETLWRAFSSRGWSADDKGEHNNSENILKIVKLKHERAQLLGFDSHADYVLEERMAGDAQTVNDFLKQMKSAYKIAAEMELETLQAHAEKLDELSPDDFQPWDVGYYSEKLKEQLYDFSSEDFRPYLQLDRVLAGCFAHFEKLFGLRFKQADGYDVWHEDVKVFEVFSADDESFIGTLYGDFHPRTGKKDGAWKTAYRNQGLFQGEVERPLVAIVCNFTKPTKDKPSLLTHYELTTLFHEMGHAIHALLSNVKYSSHAGTSVKWDFVELPSQLQENWCYEKETLDTFAAHYDSGEKIPEELIEKLRKAKNFMGGWAGLRQTNFGMLDMAWHSGNPDEITDVTAFEDEITKDTSLFPRLAGPFSCSFSHIFAGGYSAGYYSYKWAEVLDADAFEYFLEEGLYSQDVAAKYRHEILAKGGSDDPNILYRNFRGRDADPKALLRREGLSSDKKEAA